MEKLIRGYVKFNQYDGLILSQKNGYYNHSYPKWPYAKWITFNIPNSVGDKQFALQAHLQHINFMGAVSVHDGTNGIALIYGTGERGGGRPQIPVSAKSREKKGPDRTKLYGRVLRRSRKRVEST